MSDAASPIVAVGAVVIADGHLLVVRQGRGPAAGRWSVPGGRVEHGESLAAAVVRELAEETGLEGSCGAVLGIAELIRRDAHFVIVDHLVEVPERLEPRAGDDAVEARWVPLAEVDQLALADGLADFLRAKGVLPAPEAVGEA